MKNFEKIETQEKAEINEPEFELKEFENSKEGFEVLLKKLVPNIKSHKYNLIIGDDTSGRIPTLVFHGLLKKIYKENSIEAPMINFFIGGSGLPLRSEEIDETLKKIANRHKNNNLNALLISEIIFDGNSVKDFCEILKNNNISHDFAILGCDPSEELTNTLGEVERKIKEEIGEEVFLGSFHMFFWGMKKMVGVKKEVATLNPFSKRTEKTDEEFDREEFLKARRDVKKMIDHLKNIYDKEKNEI
ncbi:hypothetical protein KKA23_01495 [Patescibacteria group bacterium]|nr:hypothetical protein [Patescibacteria group bacterium]MBU3923054.1 hypothetical protein [Patescibacteria group bacterium]